MTTSIKKCTGWKQLVWKKVKDHAGFFVLYPLVVVVILLLCWPFYRAHEAARRQVVVEREQSFLAIAEHIFVKEFQERVADLRTLAHAESLEQVINRGNPQDINEFERDLVALSDAHKSYDQVRFLDISGHEAVRVNLLAGEPIVVTVSGLQDKSNRDYFRNTINLEPGQVFVSAMDLNIENNEIEQPYKPMIRFATPVFNNVGERAGIIVLNYLAGDMLEIFRRLMKKDQVHQGMLIDSRGYWLSNHDRSNEWGFMLGRNDLVFKSRYPGAWDSISQNDQGEVSTEDGLFLFRTVKPLAWDGELLPHALPAGALEVNPDLVRDYSWKIVVLVPQNTMEASSLLHSVFMKALVFGFFAMLAIILWIHVGHRRAAALVKASRDHMHDRHENAPCGYMAFDLSWKLQEANQTVLTWLGYKESEVINRHISHLMTHSSARGFAEQLSEFERVGRFNDKHFNFRSATGASLPLSMSALAKDENVDGGMQWRCTLVDIVERLALERELENQAHFDGLTNVPNRRWFDDLAERELARAVRKEISFCILMIDIDHFKNINDAFGHDAGDEVLKSLASKAASTLRQEDLFARYGGEEFIALLSDSGLEKAIDVAERIRDYISSVNVRLPTGRDVSITISIGVAVFRTGDLLEEVIKRADVALYEAKQRGRNLVCSESFATAHGSVSPALA